MAAHDGIATYLKFARMDDIARMSLRNNRELIATVPPNVLDEFYAHIAEFSEPAGFFTGRDHIRHARDMQLRHWDLIMSAAFDQSYVESVTKIGRAT